MILCHGAGVAGSATLYLERHMSTLTIKFGGTSVGSAEAIDQATAVVLQEAPRWDRIAVVVSAMSGVTDMLIKGARSAADGDDQTYRSLVESLRDKHLRAIDALSSAQEDRWQLEGAVDRYVGDFAMLCRSVHVLGEVTPRAMDTISSLGERISARIVAWVLAQRGVPSEPVDASDLIITDDRFQQASPLMEPTCRRVAANLVPLLDQRVIPVVTGYLSATESGIVSTLGRGGSDFSASILGNCLD